MKIRTGWVSNSSTSSFICEVCGELGGGHDSVSMEEWGYTQCVNGHIFCTDHLIELSEEETENNKAALYTKYKSLFLKRLDSEYYKNLKSPSAYEDWCNELKEDSDNVDKVLEWAKYEHGANTISAAECPICTLKSINETTMFKLIVKDFKININGITNDIRKTFKDATELEEFVKDVKLSGDDSENS